MQKNQLNPSKNENRPQKWYTPLWHENIYSWCKQSKMKIMSELEVDLKRLMKAALHTSQWCLFCMFMDRDGIEVHKLVKKERGQYQFSHLDRTTVVNKGFIIWLTGIFFLRDTTGSLEPGSQSQRRIWFILHKCSYYTTPEMVSPDFSFVGKLFQTWQHMVFE